MSSHRLWHSLRQRMRHWNLLLCTLGAACCARLPCRAGASSQQAFHAHSKHLLKLEIAANKDDFECREREREWGMGRVMSIILVLYVFLFVGQALMMTKSTENTNVDWGQQVDIRINNNEVNLNKMYLLMFVAIKAYLSKKMLDDFSNDRMVLHLIPVSFILSHLRL